MNEHPTVRKIIGPTILLHSGAYFDLEDPSNSDFTIEDIAHGLALTCRFAGQCARHYSVAQHSLYVASLLPPALQYAGLMHDAAEAFIGDVAKPLKVLLPDYKRIEEAIERAIFDRFDVPYPMPPEVKEADIVMLATEQRQLMKNRDDWNYTRGRQPANITIEEMRWGEAKTIFLHEYRRLRPRAHAQEAGDA